MIAEVNEAKAFLSKKFNGTENVKPGTYAIPTKTNKGKAFMKVVIDENMGMSDFHLFNDEALTDSWYNQRGMAVCSHEITAHYLYNVLQFRFNEDDEVDRYIYYKNLTKPLVEHLARELVKLFAIPDVSNRRELLCAFFKYFRDNGEANIGMSIEQFVDDFLSTQ